jgi:hypothetical protein
MKMFVVKAFVVRGNAALTFAMFFRDKTKRDQEASNMISSIGQTSTVAAIVQHEGGLCAFLYSEIVAIVCEEIDVDTTGGKLVQ